MPRITLLNAMLMTNSAMIDSEAPSTPARKLCAPTALTTPSASAITTFSDIEIVPIEIEYLRFRRSDTISMTPVLPPRRTITPPAKPIVTAPKTTLTTRQAGSETSNRTGKLIFPNSASSAANSTVIRSV